MLLEQVEIKFFGLFLWKNHFTDWLPAQVAVYAAGVHPGFFFRNNR